VRSPGAADAWIVNPDALTFGEQAEAYTWTNRKAAQFFVSVMRHKTTRFIRMIPSVLK
jgi:signal transduction histidine kinase